VGAQRLKKQEKINDKNTFNYSDVGNVFQHGRSAFYLLYAVRMETGVLAHKLQEHPLREIKLD
jgi:hypothetical protein